MARGAEKFELGLGGLGGGGRGTHMTPLLPPRPSCRWPAGRAWRIWQLPDGPAAVARQLGRTLAGRLAAPACTPLVPGTLRQAQRLWKRSSSAKPKPAENLCRTPPRLAAGKRRFASNSGQRVRRQAGALFERQADFFMPVELVRSKGHQTEIERGRRIEKSAVKSGQYRSPRIVIEASGQAGSSIGHLETAEIEPGERDTRTIRQHVAAIGGEGQLEQAAGKTRSLVDDGKQAPRRLVEPLKRAAQKPDRFVYEPVVPIVDDARSAAKATSIAPRVLTTHVPISRRLARSISSASSN